MIDQFFRGFIWSDRDIIELETIVISDLLSFKSNLYAGYLEIEEITKELCGFKTQIYGGIEYASGAVSIRFHFQDRGIIFLTVRMQREFIKFGKKNVADEITLHIKTESALLDNFINSFNSISTSVGNSIELICLDK